MMPSEYAELKSKGGISLYINTRYLILYGYHEERDETFIALLGDKAPSYFPGNQLTEIERALTADMRLNIRRDSND